MNTPVNTQAVKSTIEMKGLRKNPVVGLFMLGAIALTAKLTRDTYVGNSERQKQEISSERAKKDYALMMYDAGSMTGKGPMWDGLRHFAKWLNLYGPYGMKEDFQELCDQVRSTWKEVISPNLIPMGISLASIYAFFGPQAVHKPFIKVGKEISGRFKKMDYGTSLTKQLKLLGRKSRKGLGYMAEKAFANPLVAAGVLLMGAFGYKTWYDVKTGRAQDEYFRHELFVKDGREE
jgi:hypothetical protein